MRYKYVRVKNHPYCPGGILSEHRFMVEQIIGRYLESKHPIHHVDGIGENNDNNNFVVCEDKSYHGLLHRRTSALIACGDPTYRKCQYCKEYDNPDNLYIYGNMVYHRDCRNARRRYLASQRRIL